MLKVESARIAIYSFSTIPHASRGENDLIDS